MFSRLVGHVRRQPVAFLARIALPRIAVIGCAFSAVFAGVAVADVRSGTQSNTPPVQAASIFISSVSAQYDSDLGQFSLSITLGAPVGASDPMASIAATFSSDRSGNCNPSQDNTGVLTSTRPNSSGAQFNPDFAGYRSAAASTSSDGRTITVTGGDPAMKGRDYRCVTASTTTPGLMGVGIFPLTPPLTFTSFVPGSVSIISASQTHRRWRLGGKLARFAAGGNPPVGTTFRFTLNRLATVRFAFAQLLPGRKLNGKCVAPTTANRTHMSCSRSVPRGSLFFNASAGMHTLSFQGRLSPTRNLQPGTYSLTITANNSVGQSATRTLRSFTIIPG